MVVLRMIHNTEHFQKETERAVGLVRKTGFFPLHWGFYFA